MRPNSATANSTAATAASASVTSSRNTRARSSFPSMSACNCSGCRAVATTRSPWASTARTNSAPKPRELPVINQTLLMSLLLSGHTADGAAVDAGVRTVDGAGVHAGEEDHRGGELLRPPEAADVVGEPLRGRRCFDVVPRRAPAAVRRDLGRHLAYRLGENGTGCDGVRGDAGARANDTVKLCRAASVAL